MFGKKYKKLMAKKYNIELIRIKFLLRFGFFDKSMVIAKLIGVKNPNGINSSFPAVG